MFFGDFASIEVLVEKNHTYRKIRELVDIKELLPKVEGLYPSGKGRKGYGAEKALRMLILQFMEDLSDREMERYLKENLACKWYCGFELASQTPDHSYFRTVRDSIGTRGMGELFAAIREALKRQGYLKEMFTFVDASQLISKLATWEERDKAIEKGIEKLNNETIQKVAHDKQARYGCKGKSKFWYGYKRHVSVDCQSGLINKIAVTSAEVTDAEGLERICPRQGAVIGDKGYGISPATVTIKSRGCHDMTIKKNNMKVKNRGKDRWLSALRSPYERVFSVLPKKVRYCGIAKTQLQAFGEAIAFNLKRCLVIGVAKINLGNA